MQTHTLLPSAPPASRLGLGGHYRAMEEGAFEDRYALTDAAIAQRLPLVRRALDAGITWFDTTWRNEVAVLAETLRGTNHRDRLWINGMVLGAFAAPKAQGCSVETYFNTWLDARLKLVPGGHFDTFMINAIEEHYDPALCARLVTLLEKRQRAGDFRLLGISSHNIPLARQVADQFPAFRIVMVPYNFRNRTLESAFADYSGPAALVGMKSLIWAEYGVPFCTLNRLPNFAELFGFAPVPDIATRALHFVLRNPQPRTVICAVNTMEELDELIAAGTGSHTAEDERLLAAYDRLQTLDHGIPVFLGALLTDNLRQNYFGILHLARALGETLPELPLNRPDSSARIKAIAQHLLALLPEKGFARYAGLPAEELLATT